MTPGIRGREQRQRVTRDLAGRTIVITGGNTGLGYFTAEQVAARGARVVIASRNEAKAEVALASLREHAPSAEASFVRLDLADLSSVSDAVDALSAIGPVDALVANAGVTEGTAATVTADGFELMFGTNHLGHFALILGLLPRLLSRPGARIVHLGSISHRFFALDLDDPMGEQNFRSFRAYGRSKLAVMTFAFELDRRLRAGGHDVRSLVAHPGLALDQLAPDRPGVTPPNLAGAPLRFVLGLAGQGKDAGAWPIVMAATDDYLRGGEYVGPNGWQQLVGRPAVRNAKAWSRDVGVAQRLWALSEGLTGSRIEL